MPDETFNVEDMPYLDFRNVFKQEAEKVPDRAKNYYDNMNETLSPILKTVAIIAAGVVTMIGFVSLMEDRSRR